jgi:dipeptidyl aminopeptidase/acylaminoacyl peptidase
MAAAAALAAGSVRAAPAPLSLDQALSYRFISDLTAAERSDRVAWVETIRGVRNIWMAQGPDFAPRQLTRYTADDGQELTGLAWSPDGRRLVYVRGGDHDANWDADGKLAPDPAASPEEPKVEIWTAPLDGGAPTRVAEGDFPVVSAKGQLAYVKDDQVWTAPLGIVGGKAKPERLFFDRGKDRGLAWSPDGSRLLFVSDRGDHSFVGVYTDAAHPLTYLSPSTSRDDDATWSPDGQRIAFTRQPGRGGPPEPMLTRIPHPWAVWTADAVTGAGAPVWRSPDTLDGSYPGELTGVNLTWGAGGQLAFTADLDGWRHLYALPAAGGAPALLTPGAFDVEDLALTKDRRVVVYNADTGRSPNDSDRRHLFRVSLAGGAPLALTSGDDIETAPTTAGDGRVVFASWGARRSAAAASVQLAGGDQGSGRRLEGPPPGSGPEDAYVTPHLVAFRAPDGQSIQGQLFQQAGTSSPKPGVIFVHGGPPRQMLLGWHYMGYYSNAYALNQYLAAQGFTVLSVNYRLGIGYGRAFRQPDHAGPAGSSEYQDVLAGARFLQTVPGVDPARIGIWGGSYGGLLTALGLARNSDLFKAGVDFHGVHDWSRDIAEEEGPPKRYEQGDWAEAMRVAFQSSPDADIRTWRSPVLLIQGDDDRNVRFDQTVDLARRLDAQGVRYEELVIPNEIHGFLRWDSWRRADAAAAAFLGRELHLQ